MTMPVRRRIACAARAVDRHFVRTPPHSRWSKWPRHWQSPRCSRSWRRRHSTSGSTRTSSRTMRSIFAETMTRARTEAVRRSHRVSLCKSLDRHHCADQSHWEEGFVVFVDANRNGQVDDDEPVLETEGMAPRGITISANRPVDDYVSYTNLSQARMLNGALQMGTFVAARTTRAARGARQHRARAHRKDLGSLSVTHRTRHACAPISSASNPRWARRKCQCHLTFPCHCHRRRDASCASRDHIVRPFGCRAR